jgi:hypothetical protein
MSDTKLVCGGVYAREINGKKFHVLCTSVVQQATGLRQGTLQRFGYAADRLDEGTDELNQYKLVAAPAPLASQRQKVS